MKCINCNSEIDDDSKFCVICGKEVTPIAESTTPAAEQPKPEEATPQQPIATYVNNGQPSPQQKNHTGLVVGIVIAVVVVMALAIIIPVSIAVSRVVKEVKDLPGQVDNIYPEEEEGEVVHTVKDPTGREIEIVKDNAYVIKVDTHYLYEKAEELRHDERPIKSSDIEKLDGTKKQKEATKALLKEVTGNFFSTEKDLETTLEEAGFTKEEIAYAKEHVGIDWKEEAYIEAVYYLASGGMSKKGLIEQLQYEGYSEEYATYAASKEDIDYYEQALQDALFLRYTSPKYGSTYSREEAEKYLGYEDYTKEEIEFAIKTVYDEMKESYK